MQQLIHGFQAIQQLRSQGCQLPVFALTAHAMAGERDHCIAKGSTEYLTKPINIKKLIDLAKEYAKPREPVVGSQRGCS